MREEIKRCLRSNSVGAFLGVVGHIRQKECSRRAGRFDGLCFELFEQRDDLFFFDGGEILKELFNGLFSFDRQQFSASI